MTGYLIGVIFTSVVWAGLFARAWILQRAGKRDNFSRLLLPAPILLALPYRTPGRRAYTTPELRTIGSARQLQACVALHNDWRGPETRPRSIAALSGVSDEQAAVHFAAIGLEARAALERSMAQELSPSFADEELPPTLRKRKAHPLPPRDMGPPKIVRY